jgi:hypothetical protein
MRYELQGRTRYTSGWQPEVVSSDASCTTFETLEEAKEMIDELVDDLGWDRDDLRVVETESDDHSDNSTDFNLIED